MPELPEVETTLRGIAPHITGKTVSGAVIRRAKLRWPIPPDLSTILENETVLNCQRRAKYLLIQFTSGVLIIHLGMSGSLRVFTPNSAPEPVKHDHADICFSDGTLLRLHDPRCFGAILWYAGAAENHPLLAKLGPEPFSPEFNADYLYHTLKRRKIAVKTALMDNKIVVGVGNIYANESLFLSGISPHRPSNLIKKHEAVELVNNIRHVLQRAIEKGGSSLRDFVDSEGKSGYFQQEYTVYGRQNQPCVKCGALIVRDIVGQRGTFYCLNCQK